MFLNALVVLVVLGFPPIREIRENFEEFFQSGKSGNNRGFSAKIRGKNFKLWNLFFFKIIFKHFNLSKNAFKTVKPCFQVLSGN